MKKLFNILVTGLLGYWVIGLAIWPAYAQSPSASSSSATVRDTLRERVEDKLNQLTRKPRGIVGKITNRQDSSLLVETSSGTRQVKMTDKTVVVEITKKATKTIKSEDLGINDFIVAMGYFETKDVLSAQRILAVASLPTNPKRAVFGKVDSNDKGTLTIKHPKTGEAWTIQTSSKTRATGKTDGKISDMDVKDIQVGDRVIAIGILVENKTNTLSAKLIHDIAGLAKGLIKSPSPSPTKSPKPTATAKPAATPGY